MFKPYFHRLQARATETDDVGSSPVSLWLVWAMAVLLALVPMELAVSQLAYGVMKDYLRAPALLTHPLMMLMGLAIFSRQISIDSLSRLTPALTVGLVLMLVPTAFHVTQGSWLDLHYLLLGWGAILFGVALTRRPGLDMLFASLAAGLIAWSVTVVVAYALDVGRLLRAIDGMNTYTLAQMVLAMRYPESIDHKLFYPFFVGNWNKASNIVVLGSLLMVVATCLDRRRWPLHLTAMAALMLVSLLSFSRGGLIVSACAGVGVAVLSLRADGSMRRDMRRGALLMVLPMCISWALPDMRNAWFDMSSMHARVDILSDMWEGSGLALQYRACASDCVLLSAILGLGVGAYGDALWGNPFAGTHNMYLDTLLSGGAMQLLGLMVLLIYPLMMIWRTRTPGLIRLLGGLGIVALAVLSLREFDLNYLGVSALPALLMGLFIGLTTLEDVPLVVRVGEGV